MNTLFTAMPRRRFVTGLGLGLGFAASGLSTRLFAQPQELRGNQFDLHVGETTVNFTGRERRAITINGQLPAPILRWKEGERVTLRVTNHLATDTSIHWHGLILPFQMDGVPGLSFAGIKPGETFTYSFDVKQSGTYWYHSHSGFQEQQGMYGAIIIDPADADPISADRDHVVVLSDWSDNTPEDIFATLKKVSHYYNMNERTLFDVLRDIREKGVRQTFQDRKMWNLMRMSDSDLSDVTGYTYSFLMNGHTPDANWHAPYRKGERVRLRFINASAMTFFDVRIPGLKLTAVAADGQPIHPVTMDEFRLGVAETLDVIVTPEDDNAYSIFCQTIDRSGFAAGTLSSAAGVVATRPPLDPVPVLGHREMGMGHGDHGGGDHAGMDHGNMDHGDMKNGDMNHAEMDHASMNHDSMNNAGMDHAEMNHRSMDHSEMNHAAMQHDTSNPDLATRDNITDHLPSEHGPGIDMRAEMPQRMLDDPGIGLRNNGRKVLTYADMRSLHQPDSPHAERDITLHLTGNMSRYMWSFNGIKFADAQPLHLRYGERVRINLVNDTMMHHPIHLHGMWSDVELGDGQLLRKHTVSVKPGEMLSYLVRADALGRWAYHCHLLYHMEAGMFREVRVSQEGR